MSFLICFLGGAPTLTPGFSFFSFKARENELHVCLSVCRPVGQSTCLMLGLLVSLLVGQSFSVGLSVSQSVCRAVSRSVFEKIKLPNINLLSIGYKQVIIEEH